MSSTPTILFVPGLRDHVEQHWQTLLAKKLSRNHKVYTVPPLEKNKLSCAARVAALEDALAGIEGPVVLVAHSGGCMITAHWAERHQRSIQAALLATPADMESPLPAGYPTLDELGANGWLPIPRRKLPFPSIVAASINDPLGRIERVEEFAESWGSRLVNIGAVGHLNPASGFGEWPQAEAFLEELMQEA